MKVRTRPIISRKSSLAVFLRTTLWLACALLVTYSVNLSQTVSKDKDHKKNFGKSLDKYPKKIVDTNGKDRKTEAPNDDVIRVQTNMVVSDVLVVNPKGNALVGLKKEDFVITENGVPQDMELFSNGVNIKIPKTIVLIVEVGHVPSYADKSLEAAKNLVDKLAPDDRMAIVNTNIQLILDFTSDKKLLKSTLQKLKAETWAGRHEYSSLLASLMELFGPDDKRPIVINQSFGGELAGLKPMWEIFKPFCKQGMLGFCERNYAFSDVIETVERSRATIYTVVPGPQFIGMSKEQQISRAHLEMKLGGDEVAGADDRTERDVMLKYTAESILEHVKQENALINVSDLSGGYTSFLETPEDADSIYGSIFTVIENRYIIGYYPKNEAHDGTRRTVIIEVRSHPEYIIMGRKTYFAPEK